MRSASSTPSASSILVPVCSMLLLLSASSAQAEVFKCTTADGKTSYSATPCAAADAKEAVVPIVAAPAGKPAQGKNWAAENAAVNARVRASEETAATRNAQKASAPTKSTQQGIAECEANHGVNCSSPEEIAKREAEARAPTPEEAAANQRAAAGRRAAGEGVGQPEVPEKPKDKPPSQPSNVISTPAKAGK